MIDDLKKDLLLFYKSMRELNFNKIKLSIIFITMIASNILGLINPLLFGKIINGIVNKSMDSIKINLLLMCLVLFISIILNYINNIMLIKFTTDLDVNMKVNVFNSILKIPYSDFLKIDKGKLINNIEDDSTVFSNLLSNNISVVINTISMVISFFIMLYISPILTLILVLTLPITAIIYMISGNKIKLKEIEYRNNHDSFLSFLNETIYGWKFLKLFNAEKERCNIFKKTVNYLYSIKINEFKIQLWSGISINIVSFLANTLNILISVYLIFNGKLSLGMLTAFNSYAETFKSSSLSFTQLNSIIQETAVSLTRINEVLNYKKKSESKNSLCQNLDNSIQRIEIKDLSYSTLDNIEILKNINLEFKKSNIYIIKGESGSGKTTLLNILGKFLDIYTGDILINDFYLRNIDRKSLRNRVNYITQDNFLFSLSIKENITLYRDIPFESIENICKRLNIHDTIMSLPNEYETIINKNGNDLSGGEKQRLCIARSIVSKPDVYLFDEITSAIDKNNIEEILKIIEEISKDSIVLLTSHEDLKFSIPVIEYHLRDKDFTKQIVHTS
ncbi:ABC transporter ATP-binding protein [Romboutsia sedimentorum]|uniref:ABC transporter ATP-binding protein n=1 Tax=Romboutsia sedimentorum TaxID=1368474 RepID=UPI0024DE68E0|nr:ABC transporter ATP-binding protein [Romboutsia sedimentorum]MDK2587349.1 ABC transporter ATP-binding protein [Romboutsia sedimentorum]